MKIIKKKSIKRKYKSVFGKENYKDAKTRGLVQCVTLRRDWTSAQDDKMME